MDVLVDKLPPKNQKSQWCLPFLYPSYQQSIVKGLTSHPTGHRGTVAVLRLQLPNRGDWETSFTRNSSRICRKKMPLPRRGRGHGQRYRTRTSWEFPKEMHVHWRCVGLPFGSSTQTRVLGSGHQTHTTQNPFTLHFPP